MGGGVFQGQQRQRGLHDGSASAGGAITARIPTAVLVLAVHQDVTHALAALLLIAVPELPVVALHVMEDLRGIVLVVDVLARGAGRSSLLELLNAVEKTRVA